MPFVLRGQETVKFDTLVLRFNTRKRHDKQAAKRYAQLEQHDNEENHYNFNFGNFRTNCLGTG